jgi:O-antigen/teichoic acid export membrane protein
LIARGPIGFRLSGESIERIVTMGGSRALAACLGFLATILIARALPPATLGLWSMALACQGLALHLGEAGLRSVATAETARTPHLARHYLHRSIGLRLAISTAVIAFTSVAAWVWSSKGGGTGDWRLTALLLTSLWPIALQLDWLPLALGRNRLAAGFLLVRPTAFVILLLALPLDGDPTRLALLFLGAWWLAAAVTWPCLRLASRAVERRTALAWPRLLRTALPIAAGTIASQALLSLDLLLVGARFGAVDAAFYFLASAVLVAGLVVANGLGQAALARMGARAADPLAFRLALGADLRLVAGIACVVAASALGLAPFLLPLAFGPAYAPAAGLLLWLLPWFVLTHATTILQAAMTAAREGDRLLRANLWMLLGFAAALVLAWHVEALWAFALARGFAEFVRLSALWHHLPKELRPFKNGRRA